MLNRLVVLVIIASLTPSLAGARESVTLNPSPAEQRTVQPPSPVNLMPTEDVQERMLIAANDLQASPAAEEQQERMTRPGCSFGDFVDIHFGGYRWIYWAVAGAALVAIHAN